MKVFVRSVVGIVSVFLLISLAEAQPLEKVVVQLNWKPNVQFAGLLVAKQRGWYAEAGMDVVFQARSEGNQPIEAVTSGTAQIGIVEGIEFIEAAARGQALRAFAVQYQKSPYCILSKAEQGIQDLQDLVGKKVGVATPAQKFMLNVILANQGISPEDVTMVEVGWDLQPLIEDQIDARVAYMNNELLLMQQLGYSMTYIPAFKYGYDFYSGVYFTSEALLQERPQRIQKFLEITLRGWQEAFRDLQGTAQMVVETYFPEGDVQQQAESLKIFRMLATVGEGKKFLGWMEEATWQRGIERLETFGQIEQSFPATDLFTLEFLENIYFQ